MTDRDRGQILLVAAVVLAVTFVSLALVVNSAIFTGNLATRGETTGASDALTYRHEIADGAERLTLEVNEQNTSGLVDNVDASLGNVSAQSGLQNARRGRVVTVKLNSSGTVVEARVLSNQTDEHYTNTSGESDWTLANDSDQVVKGEFNVSSLGTDNESKAYHLYINDSSSGKFWEMAVFEDTLAGLTTNYNITVRDHNGFRSHCQFTDTDFTINVTAGEVTGTGLGTECTETLDSANRTYTGFSERDVSFGNADEINGSYAVTVERVGATPLVNESNYGTTPAVTVRIDVLDLVYAYESPSLHYNTTITIRPGESG